LGLIATLAAGAIIVVTRGRGGKLASAIARDAIAKAAASSKLAQGKAALREADEALKVIARQERATDEALRKIESEAKMLLETSFKASGDAAKPIVIRAR
jgi:hypothetical protein